MTELAPPALTRRAVVGTAGAVGLTGLAASAAGPAAAVSRVDPLDLDFEVVRRQRQVDLVAPRFRLLADSFRERRRYEVLAGPSGPAGRVRVAGGALRLAGANGAAFDTLLHAGTTTKAPYAAVQVDVARFSGDAERDRVQVGLVRDADQHLLASYDHATGTVAIDLTIGGETTSLGTAEAALPSTSVRFALGLTSTSVVALADTGSGPEPLLKVNLADTALDLRRPGVLATHRHAFGASAGSGAIELDKVEAGYFGQLGLRDPHLVTHADGRPYLRDGKAYFTFTNAGLGFFETAHWGVWTLDLRTYALEQVGNLFFRRDPQGFVYGDHAGHLVLDDRRGRWIVTNSTWGDFAGDSVEINHTTVPARRDLLHGVHVLRTERLDLPLADLPSAAVGQWDPHVVRIDGRWHVGFVNARAFFNFYPALARSPRGADYTDLRLVGADDSKVETEGPILQRFGGRWYVMASNGDASPDEIDGQYPVYDLRMRQVGVLDAPHPTNIPWPMVFPVPASDGRSRWLLVTFNGTQYDEPALGYGTHGDTIVMRAQTTRGREF